VKRRASIERGLAGLVGLGVLASHLRFVAVDGRVPADMGLTWTRLPALHAALTTGGAWPKLSGPGVWLEGLAAALFALSSPDPLVLQLLDMGWLTLLLGGVGVVADRLGGPRAAGAALLVVGTMPAVVLQARLGWVHLPEAALLFALAAATASSARWRGPWMGVLGALALALRPSALVWMVPLATFSDWRRGRPSVTVGVGAVWLVSALPSLFMLPEYIQAKLEARARYAEQVPDLWSQLPDQLGAGGLLLVLVGLALAARWLWTSRSMPLVRTLGLWTLVPAVLFLASRAGLDNFTPGFAALAVLAAVGLARSRTALGLSMAVWLVYTLPQHLPVAAGSPWAEAARLPIEPRLRNTWRPHHSWTGDHLRALVTATCGTAPCRVATDHGLLRPDGEEPGRLEHFLLGLDTVTLVDLRAPGDLPQRTADAMVHYDCPELDAAWRRRHPHSLELYRAMVTAQTHRVAWQQTIDPQCTVYWLVPGGRLRHAEQAPAGAEVPDPRPPSMPEAVDPIEAARVRPGRRPAGGSP